MSDDTSARGAGEVCILEGDIVATLERLQGAHAFERGQVNIVAFEAIASRLGRRWAMRRDLVHEHADRTLHRWLDGEGFCQRISDTDYVVVQPGSERVAAQSLCINAMRETLDHFLGQSATPDVIIHEVTRIAASGIFGEAVDVPSVEEAARLAREKTSGQTAGHKQWSPFVTSDGRQVRVSCTLEPVFRLQHSQRIGYRLARRVLVAPSDSPLSAAERRNLARADIERIDFATLARGLDRLSSFADGATQPTLILPVSFTTLSSQRARPVLTDLFKRAQASVHHGLICEVCDIEGVPPSALLTAVALIRPYCLFVVGRLDEEPAGKLRVLREGGLQGVSIECPPLESDDPAFIGWVRGLVRAARPAIKSVIVYRLSSLRHAAIAGELGVSHGSVAPALS